MFLKPKVNVIESDEGWSVEVLGRTGIKYTEGDRFIHVDSEVLASMAPYDIAVDSASIKKWIGPNDFETLVSDNDKKRITENILKAFQSQGYAVDLFSSTEYKK